MDQDDLASEIDRRLNGRRITSQQSAYAELSDIMLTVTLINEYMSQEHQEQYTRLDSIIEKLKRWLDRLVKKLTEIVEELGDGVSFSISVGTGVSVTVNFPVLGSSSA